jgi:hypothetical protein
VEIKQFYSEKNCQAGILPLLKWMKLDRACVIKTDSDMGSVLFACV